MTNQRDELLRLLDRALSANLCDPACEGRCRICPKDEIEEAKRILLTRPEPQGETPRTDAEAVEVSWRAKDALCEDWNEAVNADFARQLERELSAKQPQAGAVDEHGRKIEREESAKRDGFVTVPREDVAKLIEGFDKGMFVRNTGNDADPAWAMKLFPYLRALAVIQEAAITKEE